MPLHLIKSDWLTIAVMNHIESGFINQLSKVIAFKVNIEVKESVLEL